MPTTKTPGAASGSDASQLIAAGAAPIRRERDTLVEAPSQPAPPAGGDIIEEELLVEEISIDGMCGVY